MVLVLLNIRMLWRIDPLWWDVQCYHCMTEDLHCTYMQLSVDDFNLILIDDIIFFYFLFHISEAKIL